MHLQESLSSPNLILIVDVKLSISNTYMIFMKRFDNVITCRSRINPAMSLTLPIDALRNCLYMYA